ncbi:MAG: glutamine synthetase beta-grasp domain-containing protein, partial [Demequina sp.]
MFKTAEEAIAYVKDEAVEYIDIRFCDLPGAMQHVNVPASQFETVLEDGAAFDGSSIRG